MSMAMRRYELRNIMETPPCGFCCVVAPTGVAWEKEPSFFALEKKVAEHLAANGLDAAQAGALIHQETGRRLLVMGRHDLVKIMVDSVGRSLKQWMSGSKGYALALAMKLAGKKIFVGRVVANARAQDCVKCEQNVFAAASTMAQEAADEKMLAMSAERRTDYDEHLGVCACCSCQLKSAVHFVPQILGAPIKDAYFDTNGFPPSAQCWKRRELSDFSNQNTNYAQQYDDATRAAISESGGCQGGCS